MGLGRRRRRDHTTSIPATLAIGVGAPVLLGEAAAAVAADAQVASLPTALVLDEISRLHVTGPSRRECPGRYDAVVEALKKSRWFSTLRPYQSRPASEADVLACHAESYLNRIKREIASGAKRLSTGDTYVCPKSLTAAYYASGAACVAVDAVMGGQARNAFCLTRPPGHHATPTAAWGSVF